MGLMGEQRARNRDWRRNQEWAEQEKMRPRNQPQRHPPRKRRRRK